MTVNSQGGRGSPSHAGGGVTVSEALGHSILDFTGILCRPYDVDGVLRALCGHVTGLLKVRSVLRRCARNRRVPVRSVTKAVVTLGLRI